MGKPNSCFKIIACGNDSDDLDVSQSKGSSDKRGWSFRKRSARHRVLSNSVTTDTNSSGYEKIPESAPLAFQSPASTTFPEKFSVGHCNDEKPQLVAPENPKVSTTVYSSEDDKVEDQCKVDDKVEDQSKADDKVEDQSKVGGKLEDQSNVDDKPEDQIKIEFKVEDQSQVDDKLEQEQCEGDADLKEQEVDADLKDQKVDADLKEQCEVDVNLKEQSEVEEEVEESTALAEQTTVSESLAQISSEELRHVVKLQAAVRRHIVRRQAVGTLRCVQAIVRIQALIRASQSLKKDKHSSKASKKAHVTYISIEKLLSNSFARQLLESTPKNQPIHVKCDPSKPDSAWKWFEMWMAVSTKDTPHPNEAVTVIEQHADQEEIPESPLDSKIQYHEMESSALSETEEALITYDAGNLNFHADHSISDSARDNGEQPSLENSCASPVKEEPVEISLADADTNMVFKALSAKPAVEVEQPKRSMKRSATDLLETEERKSVFGSRKVTSPAFIAAQSKFEELTSTTDLPRSNGSSLLDTSAVESQIDTFTSEVDSGVGEKESSVSDGPVIPHVSHAQVAGSECGTEISISSTLDSPDRSDVGAMERDHDHVVKALEESSCSPNNTTNNDDESKDLRETPVSNICETAAEPEKADVVNGVTVDSDITMVSTKTETEPERTSSDVQREQDDAAASMQAYGTSPEGSPRSHLTVPESQQGTPSSLISVKAEKSKADKSGSNKKCMSPSAGKKSPSNPKHDSGSSKDHKNGKRRNSFGSTKPDQADQEPRDSSSSSTSTIPRFMQVTESARAKLQPMTSPRSSPDVHDRENYIKKRHSLPGVNGRQGSPRVVRSMSQAQAQPGAKGTEKKWQR